MFTIEMFEILSIGINFSICYELDVTSFRLNKDSSWHFFKVIEVLRPDSLNDLTSVDRLRISFDIGEEFGPIYLGLLHELGYACTMISAIFLGKVLDLHAANNYNFSKLY